MSTYAWILLFAVTPPVLLSFDKKVGFYKKWKYILPAILLTACIFIAWDKYFTDHGIWGFNSAHVSGVYLFSLPVEEILFFIAVPYASVFTYEVYLAYSGWQLPEKLSRTVSVLFITAGIVISIIFHSSSYTLVTFSAGALFIAILQFWIRAQWLRFFYVAWLVILVPFTVVNGLLTGSLIHEEVVWYNNLECMGIRLGTIPLEDFMYGLLLLLMVTGIYEWLKKKY